MKTLLIIILIAVVIVLGIIWGRNSIKRNTERIEHENETLDKLHRLGG